MELNLNLNVHEKVALEMAVEDRLRIVEERLLNNRRSFSAAESEDMKRRIEGFIEFYEEQIESLSSLADKLRCI